MQTKYSIKTTVENVSLQSISLRSKIGQEYFPFRLEKKLFQFFHIITCFYSHQ